ncbi:MAG: acetolactate synthase [Actinomycetales bacterium]
MSTEAVHGGIHAMSAAHEAGVELLFTLSGAHVFPLYDAAVGGRGNVEQAASNRAAQHAGPVRLIDVRHEQTAVFAAEAVGKLTRRAGMAALTAGPGVTNGVSAIAGAHLNGSPLVVIGGRAPDFRWGSGALQELDHPPILQSITKQSWTVHDPTGIRADVATAFALANTAHRGPVFLDIPMDVLFTPAVAEAVAPPATLQPEVDQHTLQTAAHAIASADHPVIVLGSDTWQGHAEHAAAAFVHDLGIPAIANGMGRGILAPTDPLLVTRARSAAFKACDLVIVVGTPLDFRLNYGRFGAADAPGGHSPTVVHIGDHPEQVASHVDTITLAADLITTLTALATAVQADQSASAHRSSWRAWARELADAAAAARAQDRIGLDSQATPIHPAAVYGALLPRLTDDCVVIGDGGDFVSFAGKFIEPARPGHWLDPGPYGCLGTGPGYAMAAALTHPGSPIFLLAGDGALGFSFLDLQSLVTHQLPVVIIVGNNAGWALERHPMRMLYGYDVIADLPDTDYARLMVDLGGAGERVEDAAVLGPAIDRAMAQGLPTLIDVRTDPQVAYPRSTTGI